MGAGRGTRYRRVWRRWRDSRDHDQTQHRSSSRLIRQADLARVHAITAGIDHRDERRRVKAALERSTSLAWKVTVMTSYAAQVEAMCSGSVDVGFFAPLQ